MIWAGQYNAILVVLLVVGIALAVVLGNLALALSTVVLVIVLRFCVGVLNILFKAFSGKPLIYETKLFLRERDAE